MKKEIKKGESWRRCYQQGVVEEKQAWLESRRCHTCGNEMKLKPLTDTCANCFETA